MDVDAKGNLTREIAFTGDYERGQVAQRLPDQRHARNAKSDGPVCLGRNVHVVCEANLRIAVHERPTGKGIRRAR